jgi:hypothetical protein
MTAASQELSKGRKKRVMPPGLATPADIGAFAQLSSHPLHKTTKARAPVLPLPFSRATPAAPPLPLQGCRHAARCCECMQRSLQSLVQVALGEAPACRLFLQVQRPPYYM